MIQSDLEGKIKWLGKLASGEKYKDKRIKLTEIWKSTRRSLDTSLPCIYLRYAYRQIAEDINQMALDSNLKSLEEAMSFVQAAYKRIERFKSSDERIMEKIKEERSKIVEH